MRSSLRSAARTFGSVPIDPRARGGSCQPRNVGWLNIGSRAVPPPGNGTGVRCVSLENAKRGRRLFLARFRLLNAVR